MTKPIPNAEYIRAILDGKEVEKDVRNHWTASQDWIPVGLVDIILNPANAFRIKPEPAPKREPLTVHVSRRREGGNLNFYSELFENEYWEHIGEFILQPKEQT